MRWLTIFLIFLLCAATNPSIEPNVFQQYENAFNRYDADAVASFWILNPEDAKTRLPIWKGYREFEAATNAIFDISMMILYSIKPRPNRS
jgi:hypothetical protein